MMKTMATGGLNNSVFLSRYFMEGAKAIQGQHDRATAPGSQASTLSFSKYDQEVVRVTSAHTPLASTMSHGYP